MAKALASAASAATKKKNVKKSGPTKRSLSEIQRKGLTWIENYLVKSPGEILEVKAHLENGTLKKDKKEESHMFHNTYTCFKQIKKEFLAEVICDVGAQAGMTTEIADAIDAQSRYAIRQIAAYWFGVDDSTRITRPCLDKRVMRQYLKERGVQLDSRWETTLAKIVRPDRTLNWQTAGCFTFRWNESAETVEAVIHSSGAEVVDMPVNITPKWKLECNYHDLQAGVSLGMISPRIREFYPDLEIFVSYEEEKCNALARKVADEVLGTSGGSASSSSKGGRVAVLHTAAKARADQAKSRRVAPPREKLGVPLVLTDQTT